MIEIFMSDNAPLEEFGACHFEDYHQLFDHITEIENDLFGYITEAENSKLVAYADRNQKYWRFTVYSPHQVSIIYTHNKDLPMTSIDRRSTQAPISQSPPVAPALPPPAEPAVATAPAAPRTAPPAAAVPGAAPPSTAAPPLSSAPPLPAVTLLPTAPPRASRR